MANVYSYEFLETLQDIETAVNAGQTVDVYYPNPLVGYFFGTVCGIDWELDRVLVKLSNHDGGCGLDIMAILVTDEDYSFCLQVVKE